MKRLVIVLVMALSILSTSLALAPSRASAVVVEGCSGSNWFLIFPTWYKYLDVGTESGAPACEIDGPKIDGKLDWQKASGRIALAITETLLRIATIAALVYVVYGGFRYITSQGDPEGAKTARQTILNALIGLVIALLASGIVAFVASTLTSTASAPAGRMLARTTMLGKNQL